MIGAGGAHSPTRHSMQEHLPGSTYPGTALVADVAVRCGLPRDGSALIAAPAGYVLLAPLPGGRWLTFVGDLDEAEIGALAGGSTDRTRWPRPSATSRPVSSRCPTWAGRPSSGCTAGWPRTWPTSGASCSATPATCPAHSVAKG